MTDVGAGRPGGTPGDLSKTDAANLQPRPRYLSRRVNDETGM